MQHNIFQDVERSWCNICGPSGVMGPHHPSILIVSNFGPSHHPSVSRQVIDSTDSDWAQLQVVNQSVSFPQPTDWLLSRRTTDIRTEGTAVFWGCQMFSVPSVSTVDIVLSRLWPNTVSVQNTITSLVLNPEPEPPLESKFSWSHIDKGSQPEKMRGGARIFTQTTGQRRVEEWHKSQVRVEREADP